MSMGCIGPEANPGISLQRRRRRRRRNWQFIRIGRGAAVERKEHEIDVRVWVRTRIDPVAHESLEGLKAILGIAEAKDLPRIDLLKPRSRSCVSQTDDEPSRQ